MMKENGSIRLVLGGSRSGKSRIAERLAISSKMPVTYVATFKTANMDPEMQDRIQRHRVQRPAHWELIENTFDLKTIAAQCAGKTVLLDCLTMWLSHAMQTGSTDEVLKDLKTGLLEFQKNRIQLVLVSNEIGMGLVPIGPENRQYRDLVGWANQLTAEMAKEVYFVVAGIPLILKSNGQSCGLPVASDV